MSFRPLRQHRYEVLTKEGFLPFEAKDYSRLRFKDPGVNALRVERRAIKREAIKTATTQKDYREQILNIYQDKKLFATKKRHIPGDPYKLYKEYNIDWHEKQPEGTIGSPRRPRTKSQKGNIKEQRSRRHEREKAIGSFRRGGLQQEGGVVWDPDKQLFVAVLT